MNKVALISPSQNAVSETFIKKHRSLLGEHCVYYYGGELPFFEGNGKPIMKRDVQYFVQSLANRVLRKMHYSLHKEALGRSFIKNNISIVLAEYGTTAAAVYEVCEKLGIPIIPHFHGFDISMSSVVEKHADAYRNMFTISKKVISVSPPMTDALVNLGCERGKIVELPCAPDASFFTLPRQEEDGTLLFVGRFVEKKAPHLLILAFQKVLQLSPEAKLILVGDGPLLGACKQLVSALNIPNIEFKGALMHKDVKALFSTTSIFVQHSMQAANGDMEGTPVSVMEASAAGIPVVSTDHAGIPYVVEHGKTGYIVKEGDISSMAQYIHELLVSKEKRDTFASAAKLKMAESFKPEQYEQRFLKTVFDDN